MSWSEHQGCGAEWKGTSWILELTEPHAGACTGASETFGQAGRWGQLRRQRRKQGKEVGNRRAEPKGSSIRLEQRVCYGWVFMEHGGEEMKPKVFTRPQGSDAVKSPLETVACSRVYRLEERPSADT